jgi:hypothetical protein
MAIWAAVPEANLAGTTKMTLFAFAADGNNIAEIQCDTTANRFTAGHTGASSAKTSTGYAYNDIWQKGVAQWHHFAMTFADGGTLQFYIDGKAQTPATSLGTWSGAFATALMCLGSDHTTISDPFNGWLAHFVWSNAEFTADEIATLADARP